MAGSADFWRVRGGLSPYFVTEGSWCVRHG